MTWNVAQNLFDALMMDMPVSPAAQVDFGIVSRDHYTALQHLVRAGEIRLVHLEAAVSAPGTGPYLTDLVNRSPSNPRPGIVFQTPWDELEAMEEEEKEEEGREEF